MLQAIISTLPPITYLLSTSFILTKDNKNHKQIVDHNTR